MCVKLNWEPMDLRKRPQLLLSFVLCCHVCCLLASAFVVTTYITTVFYHFHPSLMDYCVLQTWLYDNNCCICQTCPKSTPGPPSRCLNQVVVELNQQPWSKDIWTERSRHQFHHVTLRRGQSQIGATLKGSEKRNLSKWKVEGLSRVCFGICVEKSWFTEESRCGGPRWHHAHVQQYWAGNTGWLPNGAALGGVREGSGCFLLICVRTLSKQSSSSLPAILQTQSNPQNHPKPTSFKD